MTGKKKSLRGIKKNPWMISTVVLAVLVVVLGFSGFIGDGSVSGNAVGQKFVDKINAGGQTQIEFVSVKDFSPSLYEVTVKANGQEVPAYITKDGEYFVQVILPLDEEVVDTTASDKPQEPEVVKSAKPKVDLFVMSYCPYGTQALKGIIPAIRELGDTIDFNLRFVNYAMHGEKEVVENTNMYCIREEQNDKLLDYLECYLGTEAGSAEDAAACRAKVGIDEDKLKSCVERADSEFQIMENSDNPSGRYPVYLIDDELNKQYGVSGSPTLVINGAKVSSARNPQAYLDVICSAFTDVPEICGSAQVSSENPSPGFGYSTTTSGSTASCG